MKPDDQADMQHLSEADLAVLAERGVCDSLPAAALDHLSTCRRCMTLYTETVRYHAAWLAMPEAFAPRPAGRRANAVPVRALALTASGLVLAGFLFTVLHPAVPPLPGRVREMLERSSGLGLVLPGGEAGATRSRSVFRSEGVGAEDARTVEQLRGAFERNPAAVRDLYPLAAALVATGRTDAAADYIRLGQQRTPGDHRFLVLSGVVAYERRNFADARRALDEALRLAPHDLTARLDRGLVELEQNGAAAAAPWLDEVIRRAPGSPLAARAKAARVLPA
jgi:tetratricopeptide (TPR) repeat protein